MPSSIPVLTRPSKGEIRAAAGRIIPDVIAAELKVLFCGINPGLYSGATGYHFARPGNRFWPTLCRAGFMEAATGTPAGPALPGTSTGAPRGTDAAVCTGGYRRDPRPRKGGSGSPGAAGALGKVAGWATRKASGWRTPERRARQAEMIRNWRPWKAATGPRTDNGKARSSRNALKHGGPSMLAELVEIRQMLREMQAMEREMLGRVALQELFNAAARRGLQAHRLETLTRYESHLDRQFERMVAMLMKRKQR